MRDFIRPTIVVSKCLEFDACRYNGQMIHDDFVNNLQSCVDFIPVCPEFEIGLGIPRDPIRIVKKNDSLHLIQPSTGDDHSEKMRRYSNLYLESLHDVDGFILKSQSPSCGIHDVKIYAEKEQQVPFTKSSGFFAREVLERFPHVAIEDEARLKNQNIKDHFLTKLYTLADFRMVKKSGEYNMLVEFQKRNNSLFKTYHQEGQKKLGNIIEDHDNKSFEDVIITYEKQLHFVLKNPPTFQSIIHSLMYIMGSFSKEIRKSEKDFIIETLEQYGTGQIPLTVPLYILKSWVIRFEETHLLPQTIFEPYPLVLA